MTEVERNMIKMQHKARALRRCLERFEVAVIDQDICAMSNELYWLKQEIENTYVGMEIVCKQKEEKND